MSADGTAIWADAVVAAALFAVDPVGCGGIVLRARAGPERESWLAFARGLLPPPAPFRRLPPNLADDRLIGGLDLAATLGAGRPIAQSGILAEADGGVVVLCMAERTSAGLAARLGAVLDRREVAVERDGIERRQPTSIGVIALDEGVGDNERAPAALRDRLGFHIDLDAAAVADTAASSFAHDGTAAARRRLPEVCISEEILRGLCGAALALGIPSIRPVLFAAKAARAAAAIGGRTKVSTADAAIASRLVLAPRATSLSPAQPPSEEVEEAEDSEEPPPPAGSAPPAADPDRFNPSDKNSQQDSQAVEEIVLAAAQAAIPPRLLAQLRFAENRRPLSRPSGGRSSAARYSPLARPAGRRAARRAAGPKRKPPQPDRDVARRGTLATSAAAGRRGAVTRSLRRTASKCGRRISGSPATSSGRRRPRFLLSMPPGPRRCIGWPRPRERSNCCWPNATSGATEWR